MHSHFFVSVVFRMERNARCDEFRAERRETRQRLFRVNPNGCRALIPPGALDPDSGRAEIRRQPMRIANYSNIGLCCSITRTNVVRLVNSLSCRAPTYVQPDRMPPSISWTVAATGPR